MTGTENMLTVSGNLDPRQPETGLMLPDGRVVKIQTSLLLGNERPERQVNRNTDDGSQGMSNAEGQTIPLLEEQLHVEKRTVETGKIMMHKTVENFETKLDEPLSASTFQVERVSIERVVEAAPGVRQQGLTTVYPVVEERLVLTRQLVLKEELHVTRHDSTTRDTRTVTLRREHIEVERT